MKTGISFLTILLFVVICKNFTDPREIEVYNNPLDTILGEKWRNEKCIRRANFPAILNKRATDLNRSSEVYSIKRINANFYFLRHKKKFAESKTYSLIVKTNKNKIVAYNPIKDYHLFDVIYYKEKLYYLADDFRGGSSNYGYVISCLDKNLNLLWSREQQSKVLPFKAKELKVYNDSIEIHINSYGASTMFNSILMHIVSTNGNLLDSKLINTDDYCPVPPMDLIHKHFKLITKN